ncbi:MAG: hypothetical protein M3165_04285, partial [Actinomycetota bacterium]|nr:hypothetical protein [Actinomycetota bacterium]
MTREERHLMLSAGTAPRAHDPHPAATVAEAAPEPTPLRLGTGQDLATADPSALTAHLAEALSAMRAGAAE